MNILSIIFQKYIEITFIFYAYTVGYLYLAIVYLPSFVLPPLKRVLSEFEERGTTKSASIISIISGSILFVLFLYLEWLDPTTDFGPIAVFFLYIGYFVWGFFALFLLADYRTKFKEKTGVS